MAYLSVYNGDNQGDLEAVHSRSSALTYHYRYRSVEDLLGRVAAFSVQEDLVVVELEERTSVRHREEGDVQLLCLGVELGLEVHTDCTCAFVKDSENRAVVEETGHGDALLLASRKHILPVVD